MLLKAQTAGCSILPVSIDYPDYFGVFARSSIKKGEVLFHNGNFDVSHEEVCIALGVEPENFQKTRPAKTLAVPRKTKFGKKKKTSTVTFKPPDELRHIYSFLQSERAFKRPNDFGSAKNNNIKWVDLKRNHSPTVFINSVGNGDSRSPNVEFWVDTADKVHDRSVVVAVADIAENEELLLDYYNNTV